MAVDITPSALLEFAKTITGRSDSVNNSRIATVTRIDKDGVAYVSLPGGVDETPIATAGAMFNVGDTVYLTMSGGRLRADYNLTAPSIGARVVKAATAPIEKAVKVAKQAADEAGKVANAVNQHFWTDDNGAHVTDVTQDEWKKAVDDGFSDLSADKQYPNLLENSLGILLRSALNNLVSITRSAIAFYDGQGNNAANIMASFGVSGAQIGKVGAAHSIIDADGQRFYAADGSTQLANIGYGEGNANSGTSTEPYYTFGTRWTTATAYSTSSTYAVGDMCVYDSKVYVCITPVTIPGAWNSARWQLAIGNFSVAEGQNVIASGAWSHAEGYSTTAVNLFSHAEGNSTTANHGGHAEGSSTIASGAASHAEGYATTASGTYSHAQNQYAKASKKAQTAIGTFNVEDNASYTTTHPSGSYDYGNYAFIVGNGTADDARSNALTLGWDGTLFVANGYMLPNGSQIWDNSNRIIHMQTPDAGTSQAEFTFEPDGKIYSRKRSRSSASSPWGSWSSWATIAG